jgi:hypothetical protein
MELDPDIEEELRSDWTNKDNKDGICMHCGNKTKGIKRVCDDCYSLYTPAMLSYLEG